MAKPVLIFSTQLRAEWSEWVRITIKQSIIYFVYLCTDENDSAVEIAI